MKLISEKLERRQNQHSAVAGDVLCVIRQYAINEEKETPIETICDIIKQWLDENGSDDGIRNDIISVQYDDQRQSWIVEMSRGCGFFGGF